MDVREIIEQHIRGAEAAYDQALRAKLRAEGGRSALQLLLQDIEQREAEELDPGQNEPE